MLNFDSKKLLIHCQTARTVDLSNERIFLLNRFNSALAGAPMIFADQFIQMSTSTDTGLIYGLGEHRTRLLHNASSSWQQYVMWARDSAPQVN